MDEKIARERAKVMKEEVDPAIARVEQAVEGLFLEMAKSSHKHNGQVGRQEDFIGLIAELVAVATERGIQRGNAALLETGLVNMEPTRLC